MMPAGANLRRQLTSVFLSVDVVILAFLGWSWNSVTDPIGRVAEADTLGLLAACFLYLTLLISPLMGVLPRFRFRREAFSAKRGLGLSSLLFAAVHGWVSFWGPVGGWAGTAFLDPASGLGVICGVFAGLVLVLLGATAGDGAVRILGFRRWKRLHRWIYGAGLVLLAHGLLVGPHFVDRQSLWTGYVGILVLVLLVLEAHRFDRWYRKRFPQRLPGGPVAALAWVAFSTASAWLGSVSPWFLWAAGLLAVVLAIPLVLLDRWVVRRFVEVRRFGPGALLVLAVASAGLTGSWQGGGFSLGLRPTHAAVHPGEPLP